MNDGKSQGHIQELGDHEKCVSGVPEPRGNFLFVGAFDCGNVVGVGNDKTKNGMLASFGFRLDTLLNRINVRNLVDQLLSKSNNREETKKNEFIYSP